MFQASPPQFPTFEKYFFIFARQQNSGECNEYYTALTSNATDHDGLKDNKGNLQKIGSTVYTYVVVASLSNCSLY